MYAIVKAGGKQYKVSQGELVKVEKIPGEVGSQVTLDQVCLVKDGEQLKMGQPILPGAAVQCEIVGQGKAKKIIVFKMKRRKKYRRKKGHRQLFTTLKVERITLG